MSKVIDFPIVENGENTVKQILTNLLRNSDKIKNVVLGIEWETDDDHLHTDIAYNKMDTKDLIYLLNEITVFKNRNG